MCRLFDARPARDIMAICTLSARRIPDTSNDRAKFSFRNCGQIKKNTENWKDNWRLAVEDRQGRRGAKTSCTITGALGTTIYKRSESIESIIGKVGGQTAAAVWPWASLLSCIFTIFGQHNGTPRTLNYIPPIYLSMASHSVFPVDNKYRICCW